VSQFFRKDPWGNWSIRRLISYYSWFRQAKAVSSTYVSVQRGKTSTLAISSFTDFALAGNRGKDSNHASHLGQCHRWRMTLSSKNSDLCGAIISWLHRTHWIPNMNIERCFFIVVRRLKSPQNAENLPRDYLSYVTAAATINHFSLSFAFPCSEKCLAL
jgi:hypothetical protein